MKLKNYIYPALVVGALSLVSCSGSKNDSTAATGEAAAVPADMQAYKGTDFTINYPKTWNTQPNATAVVFAAPIEGADDTFQENVNVLSQDLSAQPMTLDEYTDFSKKQILAAMGADAITSIKRVTLDGKPADEAIYAISYQGKSLKIKGTWFIENNKAYVITYTAEPAKFDSYMADADKTISSFKLNNKN